MLCFSCQAEQRFPVILTQINSSYLFCGTKAGIGRTTVCGKKGQRIIDGEFLMAGPFVSQIRLKIKFIEVILILEILCQLFYPLINLLGCARCLWWYVWRLREGFFLPLLVTCPLCNHSILVTASNEPKTVHNKEKQQRVVFLTSLVSCVCVGLKQVLLVFSKLESGEIWKITIKRRSFA